MKKLLSFLSVLSFVISAGAQTRGTVDEFLSGLLSMSSSQCQGRGEAQAKLLESNGRLAEAHSIRGAEKLTCECVPKNTRELQATLSKEERGSQISEAEFSKNYLPRVVNACAGAQLRSTYGDGCAERLARFSAKSGTFCSCMNKKLTEVSDAEIAEIGRASSDYLPAAAEAKKRGLSAPEKPIALQNFWAIEAACFKE